MAPKCMLLCKLVCENKINQSIQNQIKLYVLAILHAELASEANIAYEKGVIN